MTATKQRGVVAKWLNHKGIGFITPEEGGESKEDVLVHFSQIKQETKDGFRSLNHGAIVEYELKSDPKNEEKMVAVNVTGPDGADCEPRQPGGKKGSRKGGKKGKGKGKKGKKGDDEEEEEAEE